MSAEQAHPWLARLTGSHRKLLSGFAGVGMLRLVSTVASVVTTVLLARLLGPENFGAYAFAFSLASMVMLPLLQGLPTLILREVSRLPGAQRSAHAATLVRFSDILSLALLLLAVVAVGAVFLLDLFKEVSSRPWLAILAAAIPVAMIAALVRGSVIRADDRAVAGQLPDLLVRPLVLLVLLGVLWWTPAHFHTSTSAMAVNLVAAVVALGVAIALMRSSPDSKDAAPAQDKDKGLAHWFRVLLPLSIVAGLQLVNSQVDMVALGLLASASEVGVYKIASTLAVQVSFALTVVNAVVAPRFAALFREGRIDELRRVNRMGAMVSFGVGLTIVVIYLAFGRQIISLTVGDSYLPAFMPLLILSLAHLGTLWAGTTNVLLNMIGQERDVITAAVASIVVNVLLNLLLIPRMGMLGAAGGTALSLVVWRVMLSLYVRRRLDSRLQ